MCFPVRVASIVNDNEFRSRVIGFRANSRDAVAICSGNKPVIDIHVTTENGTLVTASDGACYSSDSFPTNRVSTPAVKDPSRPGPGRLICVLDTIVLETFDALGPSQSF